MAFGTEDRLAGEASLLASDFTVSQTLKFLVPAISLLDMHSFCLKLPSQELLSLHLFS